MSVQGGNIHLQSEQARLRAINLFCWVTAACAAPYLFFLKTTNDFPSILVMCGIILIFLISPVLNKRGLKILSRVLIVLNTNFAVLYFSSILGYSSGIHLYLFTSPLIVYLLFDFKHKGRIILALSSYLVTFILVYLQSQYTFLAVKPLSQDFTHLLYGINFCFTLFLCFVLIIYFANNNAAYNHMLAERNEFLTVHQSALMTQIADRITAEGKLRESLAEKNILLSEIHHRVKNNLAVVSGLLELQSMETEDEKLKEIFAESRNRIKSLAHIHESLYQQENLAFIRFDRYFERILPDISNSYAGLSGKVRLDIRMDPVELEISMAIPCGLLMNEIVSNAFKHVFRYQEEGLLTVVMKKEEEKVFLMVSDSGSGFPDEKGGKKESLGMTLIEAFVMQLKGKMELSNEHGAVFRIWFPVKNK
ncbi:MAG: sensor histidine kinase [Bacteroidia bacterium]